MLSTMLTAKLAMLAAIAPKPMAANIAGGI
jgi:hypothetical protein